MAIRVFVSKDKITSFSCPKCGRSKNQDVTSFLNLDREIKAKIRCKCGNTFKIVLERRNYYRKQVDLVGAYWIKEKGLSRDLVIKDISRNGIKFHVNIKPTFTIGDKIWVEFRLDNYQKTMILKRVIIRSIKDGDVGVEFLNVESENAGDIAIGFYLM